MDLIVTLGYKGQDIIFLDNERIGFVTGRALCIYDLSKGPRDIIWKNIKHFAINFEEKVLISISHDSNANLELLRLSDLSIITSIKNPSSAELISVSFSRKGDRLYTLSGSIDHRILVWNINKGSQMQLITSTLLSKVSRHCVPNPCDSNYFVLMGDEGIVVGVINEIFEEYSSKMFPVVLDATVIFDVDLDENFQLQSKIFFCVWLPGNRILIGTSQGLLFEVNCESIIAVFRDKSTNYNILCQRYIGKFYVDDVGNGAGEYFIPTCAVATSTHLIVGTEEGYLYWYQFVDGISSISGEVINCKKVQQKSSTRGQPISCLTIDQKFLMIVIGTFSGEIFRVSSELQENMNSSNHGLVDDNEADGAEVQTENIELVELELVGNEFNVGNVLTSKSISVGVEKLNGRVKGSLSLLVTGSHSGVLTFWKQPVQQVEPMTIGGGIRRSNPRPLVSVLNVSIGQTKSKTPLVGNRNPSVCCIEMIPWIEKPNAQFVCVGSDDGWLEVWVIEAIENEEDEVRDAEVKLVEDDDGGVFVRLDSKKVFESRIYNTSLTSLTPAIFSSDDKNFFNICTASAEDNRIFMVTVMLNDTVVLKTAKTYFSVASADVVRSLHCTGEQLHAWGGVTGDVYVFDLLLLSEESLEPIVRKSGMLSVYSVNAFKRLPGYLVLNGSNDMFYVPSSEGSVNSETSGNDVVSVNGIQSFSHDDIVICSTHSSNGRYLATGCMNGSLYIWKLDHEGSLLYLVNQLQVHAGSVACLTFSVCSSFLLTHGVDGSCFLFSVDKIVSKGVLRSSVNLSKLSSGESLSVKDISFKPNDHLMTWSQIREVEKIKEMQSHYKFKTMGISAAVKEISNRLNILLEQNSNRNDLEKMDEFEFVIDEKRKEELSEANISKVIVMKNQYKRKNLWHELRAARVRTKCWDPLESSSSTLLPFTNTIESRGYSLFVTSFSVEKINSDWNDLAAKVMRLRAIEIRTMRSSELGFVKRIPGTTFHRSAWNNSLRGCPSNISWISCDGFRWPVNEQIETLLNGEKITESKEEKNGQAATLTSEEEEESNYLDEETELDEMNILNLLYPPQAVRTQLQKRTQIILLKEVVRRLRIKFNKKYEQLYKEKEEIIISIESRNSRIKTILNDLHQEEENLTPKFDNVEIAGSAIRISDDELLNRPYETESARLKRIRDEEEKRRKELENDKEDVKGRALDEMMYGTLEVKRDVFAEASSLIKPEWMDILSPSEMNESQIKEYDAYQQKVKGIMEEQANYRKVLEQEIKKLKTEIVDLCKTFDDKLDELSKLKIVVHRELLSNEVYISRIAMNMAKTEQNWKYLKRSEEQIVHLRKERSEIRVKIDKFNLKLEDIKTQIGLLQEEERQMDKSFKRDLQNLCNTTFDQDTLKVFTQLYRLRVYPKGAQLENTEIGEEPSDVDNNQSQRIGKTSKNNRLNSSRSKKSNSQSRKLNSSGQGQSRKLNSSGQGQSRKLNSSGQENAQTKGRNKLKSSTKQGTTNSSSLALGPMQLAAQALNALEDTTVAFTDKDPYYETLIKKDLEKKGLENQIPIITTLNLEIDCPEGFIVDQFTWSKLQDLRIMRIEKEISVKRLTLEFNKIKLKLESMDIEEAVLVNNINEMKSNRDSSLFLLKSLESDLDVIVCLRQGQDEVEKDAVVTDYNNAILIPSDVVGKYNYRIKELGKEKINILTKIKQFRRKINLIDWEAKHNGLEASHYEAYLTDLQLFRVTRELQRVIRDGSDASQVKERLDKVSMRKDYLTKDAEEKLNNLKIKNDAVKRQLLERSLECSTLDSTINNLRSEVESFQDVKNSRDEARGIEGNPANIAANKMKKVVGRRHMVDTARAQAEEIDFLRQELDKMRQRTFPSFVRFHY